MEVADGASGPPWIVLEHALDFMTLDELLLCVMPVSRLWRSCALDHRTYWQHISLERDHCSDKYIDLFLMRVSRALGRPITVTIDTDDPRAVLPEVKQHVPYITRLDIQADIALKDSVFDALRGPPALSLNSLRMCFDFVPVTAEWDPSAERYPTLPLDLFLGCAPALSTLVLYNIALPLDIIPPYLNHLTVLSIGCGNTAIRPVSLPGNLVSTLALRRVVLDIDASTDDPTLLNRATWESVEELVFRHWQSVSRPGGGWQVLALPIDRVQTITQVYCDAAGVLRLVESLKGPLCLAVSCDMPIVLPVFDACFTTLSRDGLKRRVTFRLPKAQSEDDTAPICALRSQQIVERIHALEITFKAWMLLIPTGRYFAGFPLLSELRLVMPVSLHHMEMSIAAPTLSCPRLRCFVLCLEHEHATPEPIDAATIAHLLTTSLSDAPLPISLGLDGFELVGEPEKFLTVFIRSSDRV
ncbi:hypothetical protein AURDEDRAFT_161499 [Auricularia subglabra TFB-10046 SS5]|nr:hypothetical protein AURDEDRAFT_161499 [Auricularia subglabra TFB-10046 SS5]